MVAMCCALFGGGEEAAGTMTSGGTESIIMAVKTHRDYGSHLRRHEGMACCGYPERGRAHREAAHASRT